MFLVYFNIRSLTVSLFSLAILVLTGCATTLDTLSKDHGKTFYIKPFLKDSSIISTNNNAPYYPQKTKLTAVDINILNKSPLIKRETASIARTILTPQSMKNGFTRAFARIFNIHRDANAYQYIYPEFTIRVRDWDSDGVIDIDHSLTADVQIILKNTGLERYECNLSNVKGTSTIDSRNEAIGISMWGILSNAIRECNKQFPIVNFMSNYYYYAQYNQIRYELHKSTILSYFNTQGEIRSDGIIDNLASGDVSINHVSSNGLLSNFFTVGDVISKEDIVSLRKGNLPNSKLGLKFIRFLATDFSDFKSFVDSQYNTLTKLEKEVLITDSAALFGKTGNQKYLDYWTSKGYSLAEPYDGIWLGKNYQYKVHPLLTAITYANDVKTYPKYYSDLNSLSFEEILNYNWPQVNRYNYSYSPFAIQEIASNSKVVEHLVNLGIQPKIQDLHKAIQEKNYRAVDSLAGHVDLNEMMTYYNPLGEELRGTILHTIQPHVTVYNLKDKNALRRDDVQETLYGLPVDRAREIASKLIELGADPSIRNNFGRTPYDEYISLQQYSQETLASVNNTLQANIQRVQAAAAKKRRIAAQKKAEEESGFDWAKAAALTTGIIAATAGGDIKLDSAAQAEILTGIVADGFSGDAGASNTVSSINSAGARLSQQALANNPYSSSQSTSTRSYGPAKSNALGSSANCVSNPNVQLASMCKQAQAYYDRYVQLHNTQGPDYASEMYQAHVAAAQNALNFRSDFASNTSVAEGRSTSSDIDSTSTNKSRQQAKPIDCDRSSGASCAVPH